MHTAHPSRLNTGLQDGRQQGQSMWDLPAWGHELSRAVYPLFLTDETELSPLGTAFCIGTTGVIMTAQHNVVESCRPEGIKAPTFGGPLDARRQAQTLHRGGLAVLCHSIDAAYIRGLASVYARPPGDVAIALAGFPGAVPWLALPLSFAIPRVGSLVTCVGYTEGSMGRGALDVNFLRSGQVDLKEEYSHRLKAVEGRVKHVFTQAFTPGFLGAPCFSIDAEVPHGLSGGPVLNDEGFVCGVVSAGATEFFDQPSSLISLLFPMLLTAIPLSIDLGPVTISRTAELADLIHAGVIQTDGSEQALDVVAIDEGRAVNAPCPTDKSGIYDDFSGFLAGAAPVKVVRK